jgi:hypothetical protein
MLPTTLFNSESIAGVSLVNFTIDSQVTVAAIGIPVGVSVTFEMVHISVPNREQLCPGSCEIPAVQMPSETAWQPLTCCDGTLVGITSQHPYALLDSPQHVRMRALMTGFDFSAGPFPGEIIVYPSTSTIPTEGLRGCCGHIVNS